MKHPPLLSGRAALESLYNSAVSVMEQTQKLVQLTKPNTAERVRGIAPAKRKTPAGTRTVAPAFGVEELGRIVDGAWIKWRAATLMSLMLRM